VDSNTEFLVLNCKITAQRERFNAVTKLLSPQMQEALIGNQGKIFIVAHSFAPQEIRSAKTVKTTAKAAGKKR
jgi:hypothetical protein